MLSLVVPLNSSEIKVTLMAVVALPIIPAKVSKQAVPNVAWPEGYAGKFGVRLSPTAPAGIGAMGLLRGAPSGFQKGSPLCLRSVFPSKAYPVDSGWHYI